MGSAREIVRVRFQNVRLMLLLVASSSRRPSIARLRGTVSTSVPPVSGPIPTSNSACSGSGHHESSKIVGHWTPTEPRPHADREAQFIVRSSRVIDVRGNQLRTKFASLLLLRTSCTSFLYNLGLRSTLKPQRGKVCFVVKSSIGLGDLRLCLL